MGYHWAKGVLDTAGGEGLQECRWEGRPGPGEGKHRKAWGRSVGKARGEGFTTRRHESSSSQSFVVAPPRPPITRRTRSVPMAPHRHPFLSVIVLALTAALSNAQDNAQSSTYSPGFAQALNAAGPPFASAVGFVNSTGTGNQLLVALSNQKNHYIVLAPNNDARQSVPSVISSLDSIPTSTSSLQHTRERNSRPQRVDGCRRIACRVWSLRGYDR